MANKKIFGLSKDRMLVEVKDGDVFINGEFASQLCWDEDSVGYAVAEWLKRSNEEGGVSDVD